jgi:hypothetical protein
MPFVAKNRNKFIVNSEMHSINTRQQNNLHLPLVNLRKYQMGIYYMGTKVYNNLPEHIKDISSDIKKFEIQIKKMFTFTFLLFITGIFLLQISLKVLVTDLLHN